MLTCNRLLPFLDIEKFGLSVDLLELESLRIYPLALHLTSNDRTFESDDAEVVTVGSLHYHKVSGLDALARGIAVYSLAGVLEANLKVILHLFLADA